MYMPWAMTSGSPTCVATVSFQWIGLKSPLAPAYITRLMRSTFTDELAITSPTFMRQSPAHDDAAVGDDQLPVEGDHVSLADEELVATRLPMSAMKDLTTTSSPACSGR